MIAVASWRRQQRHRQTHRHRHRHTQRRRRRHRHRHRCSHKRRSRLCECIHSGMHTFMCGTCPAMAAATSRSIRGFARTARASTTRQSWACQRLANIVGCTAVMLMKDHLFRLRVRHTNDILCDCVIVYVRVSLTHSLSLSVYLSLPSAGCSIAFQHVGGTYIEALSVCFVDKKGDDAAMLEKYVAESEWTYAELTSQRETSTQDTCSYTLVGTAALEAGVWNLSLSLPPLPHPSPFLPFSLSPFLSCFFSSC